MAKISHLPKYLLIGVVGLYQWLFRPFVGYCCRFYPSCSEYAKEALSQHGAAKGSMLTVVRLSKCHPFHPGGIDEVPY